MTNKDLEGLLASVKVSDVRSKSTPKMFLFIIGKNLYLQFVNYDMYYLGT